jgi:hypothetical protein
MWNTTMFKLYHTILYQTGLPQTLNSLRKENQGVDSSAEGWWSIKAMRSESAMTLLYAIEHKLIASSSQYSALQPSR